MAMWGAVVFLALAGTTVLADPSLTFPEIARGSSRIVSGWEAEDGQFPHQLSLRMVSPAGGVSSCGGSIIHAEWGMTAAHCTATRVTLVIRAGTVNLTLPTAIFETTEYYNHPLYNDAMQSVVQPNDISLIKFGRALTLGDTIQPIRMQRSEARDRNYAGVQLIASGWGRTWTNGASPENLNWVYLKGNSNLQCLVAYGGSSIIQASTICASGYNVTSQSTCQGDSGGPLTVIDDDGAVSMVGVTSFVSATGCHTDFPAGFIRPGFYHEWYVQVTGIYFDWQYDPSVTDEPTTATAEESDETTTATTEESDETTTATTEESDETTTATTEESDETTTTTAEESDEITTATAEESDETTNATDEDSDDTTTATPEVSDESSSSSTSSETNE